MNTQLLKYYDDQLSAIEKEAFEKLLLSDKKLREELQQLQKLSALTVKNTHVGLPAQYGATIIPRFRKSNSSFNQGAIPIAQQVFSGAFSFVVLGLIVWYFVFPNRTGEGSMLESKEVYSYLQETGSPSQEELPVPETMSAETEQKINDAYISALQLPSEDVSSIIDVAYDNNFSEASLMIEQLSDEDAEYIFTELQKKAKNRN